MSLMASRPPPPPSVTVTVQLEPSVYARLKEEADRLKLRLHGVISLIIEDAVRQAHGLPPDTSDQRIREARALYDRLLPRGRQLMSKRVQVGVRLSLPACAVIDAEADRLVMRRARVVAMILTSAVRYAPPARPRIGR